MEKQSKENPLPDDVIKHLIWEYADESSRKKLTELDKKTSNALKSKFTSFKVPTQFLDKIITIKEAEGRKYSINGLTDDLPDNSFCIVEELGEGCPALTIIVKLHKQDPKDRIWPWPIQIVLLPYQDKIITDELALDPSEWKKESDFLKPLKRYKPESGKDIVRFPFPKGVLSTLDYGDYELVPFDKNIMPQNWNFNIVKENNIKLWDIKTGKCLSTVYESVNGNFWPVPNIEKFLDEKNLSCCSIKKLLEGGNKKKFLICFEPSSKKPNFQIVTLRNGKLVRHTAKPSKTVEGGTKSKYQILYNDKRITQCRKWSGTSPGFLDFEGRLWDDFFKKLETDVKEGDNTLDKIVASIEKQGYRLVTPKCKGGKSNDKKGKKDNKGKKDKKDKKCSIMRGLDDGEEDQPCVTITASSGITAKVLISAAGQVDSALVAQMFGAQSFFLQETQSGVFVPSTSLEDGQTYMLHTSALSGGPEAHSGALQAHSGALHSHSGALQAPAAPSNLTGSAMKAYDGLMATQSELAHFLAENWKDSSDMIKRLGRPVDVLEDAGLRTWSDLAALHEARWDALPLPLNLKKLLAQELASRVPSCS